MDTKVKQTVLFANIADIFYKEAALISAHVYYDVQYKSAFCLKSMTLTSESMRMTFTELDERWESTKKRANNIMENLISDIYVSIFSHNWENVYNTVYLKRVEQLNSLGFVETKDGFLLEESRFTITDYTLRTMDDLNWDFMISTLLVNESRINSYIRKQLGL